MGLGWILVMMMIIDYGGKDGVDDEVNDGAGPRVKLPHMQFLSHYRVFSWAPIKELKTIKL